MELMQPLEPKEVVHQDDVNDSAKTLAGDAAWEDIDNHASPESLKPVISTKESVPTTAPLERYQGASERTGDRRQHLSTTLLLFGAMASYMAMGGHMKAARHTLGQQGKLNLKEKMPDEQKRLRRRKRKSK